MLLTQALAAHPPIAAGQLTEGPQRPIHTYVHVGTLNSPMDSVNLFVTRVSHLFRFLIHTWSHEMFEIRGWVIVSR